MNEAGVKIFDSGIRQAPESECRSQQENGDGILIPITTPHAVSESGSGPGIRYRISLFLIYPVRMDINKKYYKYITDTLTQ